MALFLWPRGSDSTRRESRSCPWHAGVCFFFVDSVIVLPGPRGCRGATRSACRGSNARADPWLDHDRAFGACLVRARNIVGTSDDGRHGYHVNSRGKRVAIYLVSGWVLDALKVTRTTRTGVRRGKPERAFAHIAHLGAFSAFWCIQRMPILSQINVHFVYILVLYYFMLLGMWCPFESGAIDARRPARCDFHAVHNPRRLRYFIMVFSCSIRKVHNEGQPMIESRPHVVTESTHGRYHAACVHLRYCDSRQLEHSSGSIGLQRKAESIAATRAPNAPF